MNDNDPRFGKPVSLDKAIESMMKAFNLEKKYHEKMVAAYWYEMMGENVAKRTKEVYVFEGKLFVRITSAPLRQEISIMKSKILSAILTKFGEPIVKDIILL